MTNRWELFGALVKKETFQIVRDPSCILVAFVMPLILLFIFGFGLSLDMKEVRTGIVLEDRGPLAASLYDAFRATDFIEAVPFGSRRDAASAIADAKVRAIVVVPNDFSRRVRLGESADIQLITDGCETNTATVLEGYVTGAVSTWIAHQRDDLQFPRSSKVSVVSRIRFNPEVNTRNAFVPCSVVLIMAIVGILLTALVVAREWERGTMEAMLATPIRKSEMAFGKLVPYYVLGMGSMVICTALSRFFFGVPLRGSLGALFLSSSVFLAVALTQGFFISTVTKNQYLASMAALILSFLPNYFFAGIVFEIDSMPRAVQAVSCVFPARYFADCLLTSFMVGDVWPLFLRNIGAMCVIGLFFFVAAIRVTPKRLE
ncbi:MAG: ABC transporter permease [Thermoguttaceae bacterium]|nr:ABC transporter permease [Thermoguttaceae bacterium]